jgi:glycosyltransferase involved in cell wall biosynthesis
MSDARAARPRCSVVVRAYNEEKHIGRLLSGVLAQTIRNAEIILVDSGSTDATVAVASRYPVRVVTITPEEFTFGRSLNRGCAAAQGEFVVVASAHVYPVYPDWLEQLLRPFQDPNVALTFGKQRGNSTTRYSEHQVLAAWFPEESGRLDHPFCNNANAAIRRDLWLRRPYHEDLPALEDVEWASWAIQQGHAIAYVAEAEVIHVHEEDPKAVFNRYRREAMALKQIRPQEHFHLGDLLRLFVASAMNDLGHAVRERAHLRNAWEILWFRWMQFWGTYRGFAHAGALTSQLKETFYYPRGLGRPRLQRSRDVAPIDYHAAPSSTDDPGRAGLPGQAGGGHRSPESER